MRKKHISMTDPITLEEITQEDIQSKRALIPECCEQPILVSSLTLFSKKKEAELLAKNWETLTICPGMFCQQNPIRYDRLKNQLEALSIDFHSVRYKNEVMEAVQRGGTATVVNLIDSMSGDINQIDENGCGLAEILVANCREQASALLKLKIMKKKGLDLTIGLRSVLNICYDKNFMVIFEWYLTELNWNLDDIERMFGLKETVEF